MDDMCDGCGHEHNFARERDQIIVYLNDKKYSHVRVVCPKCHSVSRIYAENQILSAIYSRTGLTVVKAYSVPQDVRDGWRTVFETVPVYELTANQERNVTKFNDVFEAMPDADILAELSLPAPKHTLPERWT